MSNQQILCAAFEQTGYPIGGFGDRIVGLITSKLMAKVLNREFKICWSKENIRPYFDYSKYDFEAAPLAVNKTYNYIDAINTIKHIMKTKINIFPYDCVKIHLNQDISQYLYLNKNLKISSKYLEDIFAMYKTLYTDIFLPTPRLLKDIETVSNFSTGNTIGIQIRAGDAYIQTGQAHDSHHQPIKDPEQTIRDVLRKIKGHLENSMESDGNPFQIFVTSDYGRIKELSSEVFGEAANILHFDQKVQHMDRRLEENFSKIFVDNYILSQKCCRLYISEYSNYGRIAALSSAFDDLLVFNLDCCLVDKKTLLCKEEMIW